MLRWDEFREKRCVQEQRRSARLEIRAPRTTGAPLGAQTRVPQRLGNEGAPLR